MVIYLDQFRTEAAANNRLKNGTYGNASMNTLRQPKIIPLPQLSAVAMATHAALPEDLTTADVNALLEQVYALASQI